MSTPPSTVVVSFSLSVDGIYEAPNARGHYRLQRDGKTIDWLDGLHQERFSKTELSRRSNGAPALSLIANQRYYGCFLSNATSAPTSPPARPTVDSARRYSEQELEARFRQASRDYNNGDLSGARTIFEDLVAADPGSAAAEASLGAVLVRLRENEAALVHLNRALELNPREMTAYVNRGEVYLRLGRRQEGENDLSKAISFDPEGRNPAANRARALLRGKISY
jgi:predicted Zn-dependent protease